MIYVSLRSNTCLFSADLCVPAGLASVSVYNAPRRTRSILRWFSCVLLNAFATCAGSHSCGKSLITGSSCVRLLVDLNVKYPLKSAASHSFRGVKRASHAVLDLHL